MWQLGCTLAENFIFIQSVADLQLCFITILTIWLNKDEDYYWCSLCLPSPHCSYVIELEFMIQTSVSA